MSCIAHGENIFYKNDWLSFTSLTVIDWSLETTVSILNYMNVLFTFSPPTFFSLSPSFLFMMLGRALDLSTNAAWLNKLTK